MSKKPTFEEIWDTEFFQKHAIAAIQAATETFHETLRDAFMRSVRDCESPLEAAFTAWWMALGETEYWPLYLAHQREVEVSGERFRLDMVVAPIVGRPIYEGLQQPPLVALELDGHDFHERTKEQVTHRNRRDRLLAAGGWTVLHFSGSEFHRDPGATVRSAFIDASKQYANRMVAEGLWIR